MKKTGLADSPLFKTQPVIEAVNQDPMTPRRHDTLKPRNRETTTPRYHEPMTPQGQHFLVSEIRKKVKEFGKEGATYRFTKEEKLGLNEIVYKFSLKGIRTSENEITRIAVNYIIEDFKQNDKESLLSRVIDALNS